MTHAEIVKILQVYSNLIGKKVAPLKIKEDKQRYKENISYTNYPDFYAALSDLGHYVQINFLAHAVKKPDFINILKEISFPILVFQEKEGKLKVALLSDGDTKGIKLTHFSEENTSDSFIKEEAIVASSVLTVGELIDQFELNITEVNDQESIYMVTGIPIEALVSDDEQDDHDHVAHEHFTPVQRLLRLYKVEKKQIGYVYFFAIIIGFVNLALPLGIQGIIGLISGGVFMYSVVVMALLVVIATALSGWLQVQQLRMVEILQQRIFTKAAFEFTYRIPRIRLESLHQNYAPELMNRFFDILTIQKSLPKLLIDITAAFLQIIFGLILLSFYHPLFVFFGLGLFVALVIIFYLTGPKGLKTSIKESKYKYRVVHWLEEMARNLSTFKLAGHTVLPTEKMDYLVTNYLYSRKAHFKILINQMTVIIMFKTMVTAGLLVLGGILLTEREINLGQFVAAEIIILLVINSVEKLISSIEVVYDILTAVDKVGVVTDLPLEKNNGIDMHEIPHENGFRINFEKLSYCYEKNGREAIDNVSLQINSGDRICISGTNGSGKTTLLKLICGLLHNYSGSIVINNVPLKDININSYRDEIGDNLSYEDIFEGSFEENITLGKLGIELADLLKSIEKVGLTDFVSTLPNGLKTEMLAGGVNLPKNICQKIILARSIAEKPKLVVIDDFTNHNRFEKLQTMNYLMSKEHDWTLVVISNDPAIIAMADRALFLDKGKKVFEGNYKELLKDGRYNHVILDS